MTPKLKLLQMHRAVYIAGKFQAAERLRYHRDRLHLMGVRVTSHWMDDPEDKMGSGKAFDEAIRDMNEVRTCSLMILDTLDDSDTGGREVELGIMLGTYGDVILIGPARNVFHSLIPEHYASWDGYFDALNNRSLS